MKRSSLTRKFFSYPLGQYEKNTGKSILDLMDIGNLEVSKLIIIIMLGNMNIKEEEAYKLLDEYLAEDEEHSDLTAFLDLISDLDIDRKILKSCGIKAEDLKKQFKDEVEKALNSNKLLGAKKEADKGEEIQEATIVEMDEDAV